MDDGAALPLPYINRLVMSTIKQGTVRGERNFCRSLAVVRGLARKACGSAGYSWTEAAQDGASQVAKRGLEGLLSASESFMHEGFNQVVAETAEAYLEGLKHQSNVRGRLQGRKHRTSGARRGAQCRHSEQPQQGAKRNAQGSHSEQPKAGRGTRIDDPHSLSCQACGASAEWGLRGSKEGGSIKYFCRAHATSSGCFRVDPDRAVWAADQELRRLRAKARRLEQELRDLGGPAEDALSAPHFAAGPESGSTPEWVSMPKSRSLIATLLRRGGVESNPGPTSQEEKELALKKSWQEVDSDIDSDLLDHLAEQQLTLERWKGMTDDGRSKLLDRLERKYPGPGNWLAGWTAILDNAAGGNFDTPVFLVGADSEGINRRRVKGGFFTPRTETVHKILLRVQESGVLILAGTPCSGKTSICQLVYEEAKKSPVYESDDVFYVNCAEVGSGGKSLEDVFLEQAGVPFSEASKSPPSSPDKQQRPSGIPSSSSSQALHPKKKLLILDEVQTTYDTNAPGHSLIWPLLKRLLASNRGGINILLSASRGSNPSAVGLPSTPIAFSDDQRIPLRPRPGFATLIGTNTSEPALQFTMDEYKQVFNSFCKTIGFGDQGQLQTLYDIIEATTERHPGSVLHILDLLKGRSPSNYAGRADEWAAKEVEFVTSPRLLETLSGTRSFPTVSEFWKDKAALDLISKLLASRGKEYLSVIRNADPDCADKAEELAKSGYMLLEQNVVSFTSSLHMEFYRYNLARRTWGTPQHMPGSIETFLAEALTKMHPSVLQNSLNLSTRGGVLGGVLEAHFQFELYSAITSLLPEGAYLSPTVGRIYGLEAYVDFVLHGLGRKWALELLVDGRDLTEHEKRFEPNGRYHPMLLGKQIDAWVVVDLRNPNTGKPRRVRGPGVCHVFFDSRYEKANIDFGNGHEQEVILTGRG